MISTTMNRSLAYASGYYWLALLVTSAALAQDPFAVPPAGGAAEPAAPAADDPFGAGAAAPGAPAKPAAAPASTEKLPLVIQQLRDSNPTTPEAILKAAYAVLLYGDAAEAKAYITKFFAAKFPENELAEVPNRVGTGLILRLTRDENLQPEGAHLNELIFAAAAKRAQDPAYLDEQIKKLSAPELALRQSALSRLDASGPHIVTPILRVLADKSREAEHRYLRAALARLSVSTEGPLLGALDVPNDQLKAQIIAVLGRMGSERAVMHLVRLAVDPTVPAEVREVAAASLAKIVGKVPMNDEAKQYLHQEIERLLAGRLPYKLDADDQAEMWDWDDTNRQMTSRKLPQGDAALFLATRLTADLVALEAVSKNTTTSDAQKLQLLTSLELTKVLGGLENPLNMAAVTALLKDVPSSTINSVLADALKLNRVPAIIAAIEVLASRGDAGALSSAGPAESPLAKALTHTDRRVRLAAALAIVELNPRASFAGASRVLDPLAQTIRTAGVGRVLIAHPRGEEAQTLVGFMNTLGYDGEAAYTGRRLAELAITASDIEFILISDAIDGPPVKDLVQWLRKDYRTAGIPIGVMAKSDDLYSLRYMFAGDSLTAVFARIFSAEVAQADVDILRKLAGRNYVAREERVQQAQAALAAIAKLASAKDGIAHWNLLRYEPAIIAAMDNPALTAAAAGVLATLATPKSQTALVDFASQTSRPIADRQSAAAAFAAAVKNRGLFLTQAQIATQFERYNASERLDAETQKVLGSILDAIESPTASPEKTASAP